MPTTEPTPDPAEQELARRRRTGAWMLGVGIVALFVATFAVPDALVRLAQASAEGGPPLGAPGVVATVVGAVSLLGGGALAIGGFNWRRSAGEPRSREDLLVAEQFGDAPLHPYDPQRWAHRPGDGRGAFPDDEDERRA